MYYGPRWYGQRYEITKNIEIDNLIKLLTSRVTREKQRDRQS